jgi:pimeloyl-ACP methyl ester carboxylesterase
VTAFALFVTLLAGGILYQRLGLRRERAQFAAPGLMVRVGGHRLHVTCRGTGRPLVLLESGIAASSLSWSLVQPEVAKLTRVCAYDRAGLGWSDAPQRPATFESIVDELSALIEQTAPGEPCVLVGHSFGSFVVRAYAARCPQHIAGMVLVDPAVEWLGATPQHIRLLRGGRHLSRLGALLAHLGVVRACLALLTGGAPAAPRRFVRVFGPTAARTIERLVGEVRKLPPAVHPIVQALWCQPKCFHAMADHMLALERDHRRIAAVSPPPEIPVVVISGGGQSEEQLAGHRLLAETSMYGRHVVAARSAHWVQFDEPALVVEAVSELVLRHRRS